jgi:hypothetical protein
MECGRLGIAGLIPSIQLRLSTTATTPVSEQFRSQDTVVLFHSLIAKMKLANYEATRCELGPRANPTDPNIYRNDVHKIPMNENFNPPVIAEIVYRRSY